MIGQVTRVTSTVDGPFVTVIHNLTGTEVSDVALTDDIASCFGLWFSVIRGQLGEADLNVLRSTYPGCLWQPLTGYRRPADQRFYEPPRPPGSLPTHWT